MTLQTNIPATATHFSISPDEAAAPDATLAVCLVATSDECEMCGGTEQVWQPLDQEGGPGPICTGCHLDMDWTAPAPLPLPAGVGTHVSA